MLNNVSKYLRSQYTYIFSRYQQEPKACTEENILIRPAALEEACWVFNEVRLRYGVDITELSQTVSSRIIYPDNVEYNSARFNYDKLINVFPAAIVLVAHTCDVAATIAFARRHKIPFRIRSGRHAQAPASVSNLAIIIDLSQYNKILTISNDRLVVQAGALLGPLDEALSEHDKIIPVGTCATNGLAGYSLGSGFGFFQRKYGLAIDSLLAITYVNADGQVRRLTEADAELAAFKGAGGGNFGVVTLFEYRTHTVKQAVAFSYYYDRKDAVAIFEKFQDQKLWPRELTMEFNVNAGSLPILVPGVFLGSKDDAIRVLKPIERLAIRREVEVLPLKQLYQWMSTGSYARAPFSSVRVTYLEKPLSASALKQILATVASDRAAVNSSSSRSSDLQHIRCTTATTVTNSSSSAESNEVPASMRGVSFMLMGGAIGDVASSATAFPYRDAICWCRIFSVWGNQRDDRAEKSWVNKTLDVVSKFVVKCGNSIPLYVNFLDYNLDRQTALRSYYRDNLDWLRIFKARLDPNNVFNFEQSIN